jgi:hypothetical protein
VHAKTDQDSRQESSQHPQDHDQQTVEIPQEWSKGIRILLLTEVECEEFFKLEHAWPKYLY